MDSETRKTAIKSYLHRNIAEFVLCEREIFKNLNIEHNISFIGQIMHRLAGLMPIYYLQYIDEKITFQELEKFLKKEIRVVLITETQIHKPDKIGNIDKKAVKSNVECIFKNIRSIFIPFNSRNELVNTMEMALIFAKEKKLGMEVIFVNRTFYNELLKQINKNPEELRKKFEYLLSEFSLKAIIERLVITGRKFPIGTKSEIGVLYRQIEKINESQLVKSQMRKIQLIVENYIQNRIEEIYKPA